MLHQARLPLTSVLANPRNPRRHDETQMQRLTASLLHFGQTKPILLRKANSMVIAGHGIMAAAQRAGFVEVDCVLWDVDQKTADAYMLADNRLSDLSTHDEDRVADLLREINEMDWLAVGFTDKEAQALLDDAVADEIPVVEVETSEVQDRFWISVRGPLAQQAEALQRLKTFMKEVPGVTVELGTVASL